MILKIVSHISFSRADRYIYQSVPRSRSTSDITGGKKKPPPRPPPPRLPPIPATTNAQQKYQVIIYTVLLSTRILINNILTVFLFHFRALK